MLQKLRSGTEERRGDTNAQTLPYPTVDVVWKVTDRRAGAIDGLRKAEGKARSGDENYRVLRL